MRIKVVFFAIGDGGSDVALISMIKEFRNRPIDVLVVVTRWGKKSLIGSLRSLEVESLTANFTFSVWPVVEDLKSFILFPFRLFKRVVWNHFEELRLSKAIENFRPDLIHSNSGCLQIGFNISKRLKLPHVWHLREFQDLDFDWESIPSRNEFLNKLRYSGNFSIAITKTVFSHFNLGPNSYQIYDGIRIEEDLEPITKEPYFLFVGRLTKNKGIFELLEAYRLFSEHHKRFRLLLIGSASSSELNQISKMIELCGLENHVELLGYRDDSYYFMKRAVALIVPSKHEAFGLITAEAMVNRCIVVGRNTSGTKEQFDNGLFNCGREIGFRFSSIPELVQIMSDLASSYPTEKHVQMEEDAFATVKKLYDPRANADRVWDVYRDVLKMKIEDN